jgi:hypothetical protein
VTRLALFLALLLPTAAFAQGIDETLAPQSFALHDGTTGTAIRDATGKALSYPTLDECRAASRTMFAATPADTVELRYRCVQANVLTFKRNCEGVAKPELVTFVIYDPNGVRYSFPESEDPPQPGIKVLPSGGTEYTIAEAGGLRVTELPDGEWRTEIEVLVDTNVYPTCWEWQWQPQGEPVALLDSSGNVFVAMTDAEKLAGVPTVEQGWMDGNGESGDPSWPAYIPPRAQP